MLARILKFSGKEYKELNIEKYILFPGGEVGVKLDNYNSGYVDFKGEYQLIICRPQSPTDLFYLFNLIDALRRIDNITPIRLFIPYFPYGRQDTVHNKGESLSVKVLADIINSLNLQRVTIADPHSGVTPALINNVEVISQLDIIHRYDALIKHIISKNCIFVSPDAGANKKTSVLAKYFDHYSFIRADKLRKLQTGEILETIVYADDLKNTNVLIVDDICDGGKTFIELAKALKAKGAASVSLYVTHGIFSKGVDILLKNGIDYVFTTNSFDDAIFNDSKLNAFDMNSFVVL